MKNIIEQNIREKTTTAASQEEFKTLQDGYFEQTNQILFLKKDNEEMARAIKNLEDQNSKLSVTFLIQSVRVRITVYVLLVFDRKLVMS